MRYYGQWYRRKVSGELKKSKDNRDRALEIIHETASKITKNVTAIQYPKQDYNYELLQDNLENIIQPEPKEDNKKINLLIEYVTILTLNH